MRNKNQMEIVCTRKRETVVTKAMKVSRHTDYFLFIFLDMEHTNVFMYPQKSTLHDKTRKKGKRRDHIKT